MYLTMCPTLSTAIFALVSTLSLLASKVTNAASSNDVIHRQKTGDTDVNDWQNKADQSDMSIDELTGQASRNTDQSRLGDLLLTTEQYQALHGGQSSQRQRRNAVSDMRRRWTNNQIWYRFSTQTKQTFSTSERRAIESAMREWEAHTCLTFTEDVDRRQTNYVTVMKGNGCASNMGMLDGRRFTQKIELAQSCLKHRVILHELGHTIGLYHEHNRPDRDQYVEIIWRNLHGNYKNEMNKLHPAMVNYYNVSYDFYSIMHYDEKIGSKNYDKVTIKAKEPKYQKIMGNARNISYGDAMIVNAMYQCDAGCDKGIKCPSGAYMRKDGYCKCYCRGDPESDNRIQECPSTGCGDQNTGCAGLARWCTGSSVIRETICRKTCGTC